MQQASRFDGLSFDPFSLFQDCLTPPEVDVGWGQVLQTLVMKAQGSLRLFPLSQFHHLFSEGFGWGSPSETLSRRAVQAVANRLHIAI